MRADINGKPSPLFLTSSLHSKINVIPRVLRGRQKGGAGEGFSIRPCYGFLWYSFVSLDGRRQQRFLLATCSRLQVESGGGRCGQEHHEVPTPMALLSATIPKTETPPQESAGEVSPCSAPLTLLPKAKYASLANWTHIPHFWGGKEKGVLYCWLGMARNGSFRWRKIFESRRLQWWIQKQP